MSTKKKRGSLKYSIILIVIAPILFMGLILTVYESSRFKNAMHDEVESNLRNLAYTVLNSYDSQYPGDYIYVSKDKVAALFKGNVEITNKYDFVDCLKEDTGLDVTIFYQDIRMITTLKDENGNKLLGSAVNSVIKRKVLDENTEQFFTQVVVGDDEYFAYYVPIHNTDGKCIGMVGVVKPADSVVKAISRVTYPIFIIAVIVMVVAGGAGVYYAGSINRVFNKVNRFLSDVADGNLSSSIDYKVLNRNDEFGELSHTALSMQSSIREYAEKDSLTKLYNRRYGKSRLLQIQQKSIQNNSSFTVALGDVDLFKHVNDTFGHEAGDLVLTTVSEIINRNMFNRGFAARWGGEEFLLVFERDSANDAVAIIRKIADDIHNAGIVYQEQEIKVSMTFGVASGSEASYNEILAVADKLLYEGKNTGRDKIVEEQ